MPHRIAFIGFGTVGQGLAEILRDKGDELLAQYSFEAQVVAISDAVQGSIYHPDGLDIGAIEPEEIALSIMGEIIQRRRAVVPVSDTTDITNTEVETI